MNVKLKSGGAFLAFVFLTSQPILAQDVQWKLVDSGVLRHSTLGKGIEMRIEPWPVAHGLPSAEEVEPLTLAICNHYAPSVVPFVKDKSRLKEPQFIAVRIVTGGSFGRYVLQVFALDEETCGEPLN